jgi:hypothetical protein
MMLTYKEKGMKNNSRYKALLLVVNPYLRSIKYFVRIIRKTIKHIKINIDIFSVVE